MRLVSFLVAVALLVGSLWAGFRGVGPLPPLGSLLDPARGAWAAATTGEHPSSESVTIAGLTGPVEVRYDARSVPHVFAATEDDAIRALGFVVARDRLFQLELQVRAGAGRLTELVGAAAVPSDSQMRALGLPRAAERALASLAANAPGRRFADAYAAGVNAYLDALTPDRVPVEYKLLGATPMRWEPVNALHLANRMAWTLSYAPDEPSRLAAEGLVGRVAARAIFPVAAPIQEPIQPNGHAGPRYDFRRIPPPGAPDSDALALLPMLPRREVDADAAIARVFASNNWAVAPSRSRSGHALLAGDPHLELTLPSIWFETHLVVPGVLDAYGVTIPGSPGIIIGFTRHLAWSLTNTGADVLDFYREIVDDDARPVRYLVDGAWRDIELREEVYRDRAGVVIRTDTVRFTHRGPLRRGQGGWLSMRWTALEPSDLAAGFSAAAKQETAGAFLDSLAAHYFVPAQNMLVADRQGTIAIRSTGHFPIRPDHGDGETIRDGSRTESDWVGYWPVASYPQAINPAQGYLASANQQPIDPAVDARYLGTDRSYDAWRALQINRLLRGNAQVTLDDMRRYQTDPGSVRAEAFMPYFLAATGARAASGTATPSLRTADSVLRTWDRRYTATNASSALFERAMRELTRRTWDELVPKGSTDRVATPTAHVLLELLADSANAWWDVAATADRIEQRNDVVADALAAGYDSLVAQQGPPNAERWAWGRTGAVNINHLLRLAGFSRRGLAVNGGPGTLNPSSAAGFGSSWRMVVELGDRVRAMGTYPGGQSGNPASPRYADRLGFWTRGELELLYSPPALDSFAPAQVRAALTLTPR
ncbi:MAG: penicillin acylase family protein [Gemmatimonadaceae bacterium]|nr:penicillin acylase family protein [Gemmatimonadaceae bacterium]